MTARARVGNRAVRGADKQEEMRARTEGMSFETASKASTLACSGQVESN